MSYIRQVVFFAGSVIVALSLTACEEKGVESVQNAEEGKHDQSQQVGGSTGKDSVAVSPFSTTEAASPSGLTEPATRPAVTPTRAAVTPPPLAEPKQPSQGTLAEGIDFAKPGNPTFVTEISGVAKPEKWGRWSDADEGPAVKIKFKQSLPAKFTIELVAKPFGPNVGQLVKVRVGKIEKTFLATPNADNLYKVNFEKVKGTDTIEIIPPKPTAPNALNPKSPDQRKIGLGLIALRIKS